MSLDAFIVVLAYNERCLEKVIAFLLAFGFQSSVEGSIDLKTSCLFTFLTSNIVCIQVAACSSQDDFLIVLTNRWLFFVMAVAIL